MSDYTPIHTPTYTQADLDRVRQEARTAAFRDAAMIASDYRRLDRDTLWAKYKTLTVETALEAAANSVKDSEGEGVKTDG